MDAVYVGDVGTVITVDCGVDVSSASSLALAVRTPLGNETTWPATLASATTISYTTLAGDLSEAGTYLLQAKIDMGSWSGLGATAKLVVRPKFS